MEGSCQTAVGLGWQKSKSCSGVVSARGVFFGVGRDGAIAEWKQFPPTPHPASLPCPQVCCPLDRTAFKISLHPWCSWGGKCWVVSKQGSIFARVGAVGAGMEGVCEGLSRSLCTWGLAPLPSLHFFFFFPLPWRHRLKNGKSSLKWLFSCKPF